MKVENHEGVYLSQPRKSSAPSPRRCAAPMLRSDSLPAELRVAACGVWSGRSGSQQFQPKADVAGRAVSLFYANPCIWGGRWTVWPRSSRRTGWVMETESQVSVSLPGERVSWLQPGMPRHHQDTVSLRLFPHQHERKIIFQATRIYTQRLCVCVGVCVCVCVCESVTKAGIPQGFTLQRDSGVQSRAGRWRTQNMLIKIKHQVCVYAQ